MKILYAIQTTGNGHLARAQNIIPKIKEVAELEIITSGPKNDFLLEEKPIKHFKSIVFPAPLGPIIVIKSFLLICMSMFFKIDLLCLKTLTFEAEIKALIVFIFDCSPDNVLQFLM